MKADLPQKHGASQKWRKCRLLRCCELVRLVIRWPICHRPSERCPFVLHERYLAPRFSASIVDWERTNPQYGTEAEQLDLHIISPTPPRSLALDTYNYSTSRYSLHEYIYAYGPPSLGYLYYLGIPIHLERLRERCPLAVLSSKGRQQLLIPSNMLLFLERRAQPLHPLGVF